MKKFQQRRKKTLKLVQNSVKLEVNALEEGNKNIRVVVAEVGKVNRNNMLLPGDVIEMSRNSYPFLFNHNERAEDVLGDVKISFDPELNAYVGDVNVYDSHPNIRKAIDNGAFDSVSVSYYVTDYEFGEEDEVIVKNAIMNEVSLVSVGADPNAKVMNAFDEELKERMTIKKRIKEIKANNE